MNVFELLITFATDAAKSANDVKGLKDKLDSTTDAAKKSGDAMDEAGDQAKKSGSSIAALAMKVGKLYLSYKTLQTIKANMLAQAQITDQVGKFSQVLGMNIVQVDAWGQAISRNGGSVQGFQSEVEGLQGQLQNVRFGGGTAIIQSLGMIGISAFSSTGKVKGTLQIMRELAGVFHRMPAAEAAAFGRRMGFDKGTILTLEQGTAAVDKLVQSEKDFGSISKESYDVANNFDTAMDDFDRSISSIWQIINTAVLPSITWLINGLNSVITFFKKNKSFAVGFFAAIAAVIGATLLPTMISLAVATVTAIAPFLLMGAAVVALGVLVGAFFQDIDAYIHGNKSLIGELAEKYQWFGDIVKFVTKFISNEVEIIKDMAKWLVELFTNPQQAIDQLTAALGKLGDSIKTGLVNGAQSAVGYLTKLFSNLMNWITNLFNFDFIEKEVDKIKDKVKGWFSFGGNSDSDTEENASNAMNIASQYAAEAPMLMATSQNLMNNRYMYTNNYNSFSTQIDAQGMDVEQAQSIVSDSLSEQIQHASAQEDDGVLY